MDDIEKFVWQSASIVLGVGFSLFVFSTLCVASVGLWKLVLSKRDREEA